MFLKKLGAFLLLVSLVFAIYAFCKALCTHLNLVWDIHLWLIGVISGCIIILFKILIDKIFIKK